ncbi:MAG TPA: type IV pilus modification protein PilV [Stenotrophomonas sp.]|nr:type IV pilus modification protein PilV [Stenotrophomonas sp.]
MSSRPHRQQGGFTLLEVLIAVVVLAFGLLGFALLQTTSVRFVQSANYRTQATNLAYDMTEQMRSNRFQAAWYTRATFDPGSKTAAAVCSRDEGAVSIDQNIAANTSTVVKALGDQAGAEVTYDEGEVQVAITWADERWDPDNPDKPTTFALETRL